MHQIGPCPSAHWHTVTQVVTRLGGEYRDSPDVLSLADRCFRQSSYDCPSQARKRHKLFAITSQQRGLVRVHDRLRPRGLLRPRLMETAVFDLAYVVQSESNRTLHSTLLSDIHDKSFPASGAGWFRLCTNSNFPTGSAQAPLAHCHRTMWLRQRSSALSMIWFGPWRLRTSG